MAYTLISGPPNFPNGPNGSQHDIYMKQCVSEQGPACPNYTTLQTRDSVFFDLLFNPETETCTLIENTFTLLTKSSQR